MQVAADQSAPADRISRIVGGFVAKRRPGSDFDAGQDLRNAGLTSLDLVNLMLAVEGEFDIFIPEAQMTPENFRTVRSIEVLVASLA